MEIPAQSLSHAKLPNSLRSRASLFASNSFPNIPNRTPILIHLQPLQIKSTQHKKIGVVFANSEPQSAVSADRWLLEPVGDGDSRHIGYKVAMPGSFEIASDELTVGRLPDKADLVIPVATVSARHARLEKKGGNLLVTDLESTNGTFIDEKRLTPGVASIALPGSYVTFGDTNLAIFRVSKLKPNPEVSDSSPETETEIETKSETSTNQSA